MQQMMDFDRYGLRNWLSDRKHTRLSLLDLQMTKFGITELNSSAQTPACYRRSYATHMTRRENRG
jgi:hypothetical protein